jgi:hypothetical protein
MTKQQLRRQAERRLMNLSVKRLQVADELLAYLESGDASDATLELLRIPGAVAEFAKARKQIAAGRTKDWRKVRQDV